MQWEIVTSGGLLLFVIEGSRTFAEMIQFTMQRGHDLQCEARGYRNTVTYGLYPYVPTHDGNTHEVIQPESGYLVEPDGRGNGA